MHRRDMKNLWTGWSAVAQQPFAEHSLPRHLWYLLCIPCYPVLWLSVFLWIRP